MFVTVSHNLCHHVRKNLHDLNRTYSDKVYVLINCHFELSAHAICSTKVSESRLFNVPTEMAQLGEENYPLVVPFTHLLYLLDSLLPAAERFFTAADVSSALKGAADALRERLGWRATTEERVLTSPTMRGPALRTQKTIVEYEHFERVMWPQMTKNKAFRGEWHERT